MGADDDDNDQVNSRNGCRADDNFSNDDFLAVTRAAELVWYCDEDDDDG
jgi:hypothetical protein